MSCGESAVTTRASTLRESSVRLRQLRREVARVAESRELEELVAKLSREHPRWRAAEIQRCAAREMRGKEGFNEGARSEVRVKNMASWRLTPKEN